MSDESAPEGPSDSVELAYGEPPNRLRAAARERGMRSLLDDALAKARAGLVPLSEKLRAVPYRILESG
jgi:type II secretory ATPase GspE/PulE/Tfp pilus assembly ATPase PilB-like protein